MSLFESASLVVTPNGTKASKLYSVKPTDGSGDMTVARATTATRVNSSGLIESVATNVPRLDYTNSTCPSILIEPQRTNLALRSEEFDNIARSKIGATVTPNSIVSPDGTLDADKLVENTENNQHRLDQTTTSVIGTNTFSVFAKKAERDYIWLRIGTSGAYFNLTNGTIEGITGVTASIENFGNGWYRCIIIRTSTVANEIVRINLSIGITTTYLGNGTSGVFIWGAQLEAGSSATSYIPTTTATVTRNADVISKTGISSLINSTEGTLFINQKFLSNTTTKRLFLNSSDFNNRILCSTSPNTSNLAFFIFKDNVNVYSYTKTFTDIFALHKYAIKWKNGEVKLFIDGVLENTSTSFSTFSANTLNELSLYQAGANIFEGNTNGIQIYKTALTDAELATLTTL